MKLVCGIIILIMFIGCSPGFPDKIIRGKNVTESFFLQNAGKYQNGFNKHVVFYKEPTTNQNHLEIAFSGTAQSMIIKQDNKYIVSPYPFPGAPMDNEIPFQIECKKKFDFKITRIEEIPPSVEQDKMSEHVKLAKRNPLAFRYLLYRTFVSKKTELSKIFEPKDNRLNLIDQNHLRNILDDYCRTIQIEEDDYYSEDSYGENQYFAATDIKEDGFTILDENSIESNSPDYYQPKYKYRHYTRFSVFKSIEFFKEESVFKFIPLSKFNTIRSIYGNDDSLMGSRKGNSNGITTEVSFIVGEDTLYLKLDSVDRGCRVPFSLQVPINDIFIINSEAKRSNIVSSRSGSIEEYKTYLNADIDIVSTISQLTFTEPKRNPLVKELQICPVIDKLKSMKELNQPLNLSLMYFGESFDLNLILLDTNFHKIQLFDSLERVEK